MKYEFAVTKKWEFDFNKELERIETCGLDKNSKKHQKKLIEIFLEEGDFTNRVLDYYNNLPDGEDGTYGQEYVGMWFLNFDIWEPKEKKLEIKRLDHKFKNHYYTAMIIKPEIINIAIDFAETYNKKTSKNLLKKLFKTGRVITTDIAVNILDKAYVSSFVKCEPFTDGVDLWEWKLDEGFWDCLVFKSFIEKKIKAKEDELLKLKIKKAILEQEIKEIQEFKKNG